MDSNSRLARGNRPGPAAPAQVRAGLPLDAGARGGVAVGEIRGEALMDWWIAAILHQSGRRPSSVYNSLFLESMMFSLRIS